MKGSTPKISSFILNFWRLCPPPLIYYLTNFNTHHISSYKQIIYQITYRNKMFFSTISKKNRNRKQLVSNSKSSDQSVKQNPQKKQTKVPERSKAEQDLRTAIENKFIRSKIKDFRYENEWETFSFDSEKSSEMEKYRWLRNHRFINLKEYHQTNLSKSEMIQKKYLIRIKNSESKKKNRTENEADPSPNNYLQMYKKEKTQKITKLVDSFALNERRTLSDEKKTRQWRHIGFDWRSTSKKVKNNFVSPSDRKEQTYYFRKNDKPTQRAIQSQLSEK